MDALKSVRVIRSNGTKYTKLHIIAVFDTGTVERKTLTNKEDKSVETLINTMSDAQLEAVKLTRINGKFVDYSSSKKQSVKKFVDDDVLGDIEATENFVQQYRAESERFG